MNDFLNYKELYHHGILGQKWGVRRYQNYNGSYTQAGLKRYAESGGRTDNVTKALAGVGGALVVTGGVRKAVKYDRDKKLRAYYGHTSKY